MIELYGELVWVGNGMGLFFWEEIGDFDFVIVGDCFLNVVDVDVVYWID